MSAGKLYLGCPVWAHEPWRGKFFTRAARREEFLPQYAGVFDTSEGNSTFYGLPAPATIARWAAEAPETFRFCLKFPRTITHDLQLVGAAAATREFLDRVAPLGMKLGPLFLQLHQSFGRGRLAELEAYLRTLPRGYAYAVEVRSADFFDGGAGERALDALLGELGMERVVFDTRGLFASAATDPATVDAKRKKPRVPVRFTAIGAKPFVRFVGDPDVARNDAVFAEWAAVVARWVGEGRTPYFFTHHPDDAWAPELARVFQRRVHALQPLVPAPAGWPAERESCPAQMTLL